MEEDDIPVIRHNPHPEGDRSAREGESLGGPGETPGVRLLRPDDAQRRTGVIEITCRVTRINGAGGEGWCGDTIVSGTHLRHPEAIGVGRKGRTIGNSPTSNEVVRHTCCREINPVDLIELKNRGGG